MSMELDWLAGAERLALEDETCLRLLSALEVLKARAEGKALSAEIQGDDALCANACILARAWENKGQPVCGSGKEVLKRLTVSQIQALARRWAEFDRRENPGLLESEERIDALKKAWSTGPRSALDGVCSAILGRFQRKKG